MKIFVLIFVAVFSCANAAEEKKVEQKAIAAKSDDAQKNAEKTTPIVINVTGNTQSVENPCKSAQCNNEPEPSWWHKLWFDPIATFTGALFIATAALIGTGIIQWRETRNVAKKQLRAYLGVTPRDINFIPLGKYYIQTYVDIANTGTTPAKEVQQWDRWEVLPSGTTEFPSPVKIPAKRPIVPGAKWSLGFERTLTDQEYLDLLSDKSAIYVWGRTEYKDTFGDDHWLTYRYRNVGRVTVTDAEGQTKLAGWALHVEEDGNDTS